MHRTFRRATLGLLAGAACALLAPGAAIAGSNGQEIQINPNGHTVTGVIVCGDNQGSSVSQPGPYVCNKWSPLPSNHILSNWWWKGDVGITAIGPQGSKGNVTGGANCSVPTSQRSNTYPCNIEAESTPPVVSFPSWWAKSPQTVPIKAACNIINPSGFVGWYSGYFPGSYVLDNQKAVWNGLYACGPLPELSGNVDEELVSFSPDAQPVWEWQCTELSMRWMYQAYGVWPYTLTNDAASIATDYVSKHNDGFEGGGSDLDYIKKSYGVDPQPGDVLAFSPTSKLPLPHTAVVTSYNGTSIGVIEQNFNSNPQGLRPIPLNSSSASYNAITGWLHKP